MTSLININSPLTFDGIMMGALEVYAEANQACIISPFIVGGAMAPVSVAGTLTQVLAEVLAGVAYSQLVRPGAPVIFGAFVTSIDMNSGAPTFGTPEAAQITYGAGQLARRLGLPYRSAGSFCGSKLPDAQAAYETANSLNMGLLSGVNFMLHACGWLEGGLVASFEKFVMDADQLGMLHHLAGRGHVDENAQAMDAIREVGPGGHYLGCAHTQANFKTAFWRIGPVGLQALRDLGRRGRARHRGAGQRRGSTRCWATTSKPPMDPGDRRGAGRLRGAQEGDADASCKRDALRCNGPGSGQAFRRRPACAASDAPRPSARSAPRRGGQANRQRRRRARLFAARHLVLDASSCVSARVRARHRGRAHQPAQIARRGCSPPGRSGRRGSAGAGRRMAFGEGDRDRSWSVSYEVRFRTVMYTTYAGVADCADSTRALPFRFV